MDVRDEHGVEVLRHRRVGWGGGPCNRSDARTQHGIGEQPAPAELEQHGGVADPDQAVAKRIPGRRRRHESILAHR